MSFFTNFDISGTNRSLKIPLTLKKITSKKFCVNHSKMERDARERVRNLKKYQLSISRREGRNRKDYLLKWDE